MKHSDCQNFTCWFCGRWWPQCYPKISRSGVWDWVKLPWSRTLVRQFSRWRSPLCRASSLAVHVPLLDNVHGRFSPGRVRAILGTAEAVGADFPPVHALEPGLFVKSLQDSFVAARLLGGGHCAWCLVPGCSVGLFEAREAGFGEDHGTCEFFLDRRDFLN